MITVILPSVTSNTSFGTLSIAVEERSLLQQTIFADIDSVFFSEIDGFSVPATYTHQSGLVESIRVIFDDAYTKVSFDEVSIGSSKPTAKVALNKFKRKPLKGDTIVIKNMAYLVESPQPDGTGLIELVLHRK